MSAPEVDHQAKPSLDLLIERARALKARNDWPSALEAWVAVCKRVPQRPGPWFEAALAAKRGARPGEAIEYILYALALRPEESRYREVFVDCLASVDPHSIDHDLPPELSGSMDFLKEALQHEGILSRPASLGWLIDRILLAKESDRREIEGMAIAFFEDGRPDLGEVVLKAKGVFPDDFEFDGKAVGFILSAAIDSAVPSVVRSMLHGVDISSIDDPKVIYSVMHACGIDGDFRPVAGALEALRRRGVANASANAFKKANQLIRDIFVSYFAGDDRTVLHYREEGGFTRGEYGVLSAALNREQVVPEEDMRALLMRLVTGGEAGYALAVASALKRIDLLPELSFSTTSLPPDLQSASAASVYRIFFLLLGLKRLGTARILVNSHLNVASSIPTPHGQETSNLIDALHNLLDLVDLLKFHSSGGEGYLARIVASLEQASRVLSNDKYRWIRLFSFARLKEIYQLQATVLDIDRYGWLDPNSPLSGDVDLGTATETSFFGLMKTLCDEEQADAIRFVVQKVEHLDTFDEKRCLQFARTLRRLRVFDAAEHVLSTRGQMRAWKEEIARLYYDQGRPHDAVTVWDALSNDAALDGGNLKSYVYAVRAAHGPKAADLKLEDLLANDAIRKKSLDVLIQLIRSTKGVKAGVRLARLIAANGEARVDVLEQLVPFLASNGGDVRLLKELAGTWCAASPRSDEAAREVARADRLLDMADRLGFGETEEISVFDIVFREVVSLCRGAARLDPRGGAVLVMPSLGPGGIQRQVFNTMQGLTRDFSDRGPFSIIPVSLADANFDFYYERFNDLGVHIAAPVPTDYQAKFDGVPRAEQVSAALSLLPEETARHIAYFADQFLQSQPEIVHAWYDSVNINAGLGAVIAGVGKVFLGARSIAPRGRRRAGVEIASGYRELMRLPQCTILTLCDDSARDFVDWLAIERDKIRVIYLGVADDELLSNRDVEKSRELRRKMRIPDHARIVGSAFRFSHEKRPFLWLEAAKELLKRRSDVWFVMVGDGRLRAGAAHYAAKLGISDRVIFTGVTKKISLYVDLMDVLLMVSDFEGTSNIVPEAQALGTPVVVTNVGGLPEACIPGETGLVVSADPEPFEVAEALDEVLNWPDTAARSRRSSDFIRARFGMDRMVGETAESYGWLRDWAGPGGR